MGFKDSINIGLATILVNVGGPSPLVLTGTIEKTITLFRKDHGPMPIPKVAVEGEIIEEEQFLVVDVTGATLPDPFPLTITQLIAGDVAINLDSIILILPVEVS